jgi:hypothetical protein
MKLEKFVWTGIAAGVALMIGTAPLAAKPGTPKPGAVKTTAAKPSTPKSLVKVKTTTTNTAKATSGPKVKTTAGSKAKSTGAVKPAKTSTKTTKTNVKATGKSAKSTTATTTTSSTTTTTTTTGGTTEPTIPLSKTQQKLQSNTKLQDKMIARMGTQLPQGVTVIQAASGFKNLGQFVAAVNVSNNLGIPFADLKAKMTGLTLDGKPVTTTPGTTPAPILSLGQAIQSLKGVDSTTATQAANTATAQANQQISSTTTTTTTSTTTTTTTSKGKKQR